MATSAVSEPAPHRAEINRQNAAHSTGPRTAEGKDRVRLNAIRHGFHSQTVVLPHEDRAAYEASAVQYAAEFQPQTDRERDLVGVLRDAQWRLDRAIVLQTNVLAVATDQHYDATDESYDEPLRLALAQALAFQANARIIDQLSRHEGRLYRLVQETRRELSSLVMQRAPANKPPMPRAAVSGFVPAAPAPPEPMPHFTGPLAEFKRKAWLKSRQGAAT